MKRRLRKKRRLGEFTEHGFDLDLTYDPAAEDAVWDALLQSVEQRGLLCAGASDGEHLRVFVSACNCQSCNQRIVGRARARRRSATDADRAALSETLRGKPGVRGVEAGPLVEAW